MTAPLVLHSRVVTGAGGGPDKTILNSPRYLRDRGYSTVCSYMRRPGDPGFVELETRALRLGAEILPVDDLGPFDRGLPGRYRRICRERAPSIWHGHDYKSNLLGLLTRRSQPMRLVTTVHGWVKRTARTPLYYAIDRLCLRRYDRVICVSEDLIRTCRRIGIPEKKLTHLPNAIDTGLARRTLTRAAAKRALGVEPERFVIGAVGRLSAEKGFELLIGAVERLRRLGLDCELWIAGDGGHRARLARKISGLGLEDRVKLLGFVADLERFFEAIDVYALSSLREGLPNSVLEAMAHEAPVLATDVGGLRTLILDGDNGLLIEPRSVDALTNGLGRLAREPELRARLGRAALETVCTSYSFEDRMNEVAAIYDRLLEPAGGVD